jgi:hypothetical protein
LTHYPIEQEAEKGSEREKKRTKIKSDKREKTKKKANIHRDGASFRSWRYQHPSEAAFVLLRESVMPVLLLG